jgi:hypothetical protein
VRSIGLYVIRSFTERIWQSFLISRQIRSSNGIGARGSRRLRQQLAPSRRVWPRCALIPASRQSSAFSESTPPWFLPLGSYIGCWSLRGRARAATARGKDQKIAKYSLTWELNRRIYLSTNATPAPPPNPLTPGDDAPWANCSARPRPQTLRGNPSRPRPQTPAKSNDKTASSSSSESVADAPKPSLPPPAECCSLQIGPPTENRCSGSNHDRDLAKSDY